MINRGLLIIPLFFVFASCGKKPFFDFETKDVILVDQLADDFVVPSVVWEAMKSSNKNEKEKVSEKVKPIVYTLMRVFLKEKTAGVLKSPQLNFEFSRGGGELDFATLTGGKKGSFFLGFDLTEFETVITKKILFISQSRKRKIEDEIIGSGCNKVFDLTHELMKANKKEGLKLNTTRDRHASVLGGHLIFLAETEKNWILSQVTFFDSTRPELFCSKFRSPVVVN